MANFIEKTLVRSDGQPISTITHMEIGPDGLLYASTLGGTIVAFDVLKNDAGDYVAKVVHEIDLLSQIRNHNDDGTPVAVAGRFVLGFDIVGTADKPVIYVTSNDPRIDTIADTNSGILSQLSIGDSGSWEKVDLVRGLPRSQHDHLLNDVEVVVGADGSTKLLVSTGGNTNAGAPSAPLRYLPEYVLSGAVLEIDLDAITAMEVKTDAYGAKYHYNLPTLDDPTRPGINEGVDPSIEIFGGNGGLNQAKYDPNGPVTFYATGLRNAVEILQTEAGHLLTFDNGGNPSWGDTVVFSTDADGNPIATNLPETGGQVTTNQDQLHLITPGAYFGHPNPFRASGSDAGLYKQDATGTPRAMLPSDFDTLIPAELEDIRQGRFLREKIEDGALVLSSKSTNGLAEYTFTGAFEGALAGNIFAVRYGTQSLIRIQLSDANGDGIPDGGSVVEEYALGVGGPLDVLAPRPGQPFHGVMFVSGLTGDGAIRILEPGDGSAAVNLSDRDRDGIPDRIDPFQYDPLNGAGTVLHAGETLFWDFESTTPGSELPGGIEGYRVGITGFMSNGVDLPEVLSLDRFAPVIQGGDDVVLGGTANTVLIGSVPGGTAEGGANGQLHGFQAGFVPEAEAFTLRVEVWNQFRTIPEAQRSEQQKTGAALTSGNQDTFLALMLGKGFIELVYEEQGVEALRLRQDNASLENVDLGTYLTDLIFDVDARSGLVTARYEAQTLDGLITGGFAPVQLYGELLDTLQGEHRVGGKPSALGWAFLATSGTAAPFEANLGSVRLDGTTPAPGTGSVAITASGESTFNSGTFTITNTGTVAVDKVVLTIDSTFLDHIFWDSDGSGDAGAPKPFTVDSAGGTGVTSASGVTINPLPGGGYATLVIDFPDFDPGETMSFSIDVDPRSAAGFGSGSPHGAVSGLEMAGTLVTAMFADGSSASGELFGTGPVSSSANVRAGLAPAVDIKIGTLTNGQGGLVQEAGQVVELRGQPGARVAVVVGSGDTLPDDGSAAGLGLGPLGFNSIEGVRITYVTLDSSGFGTVTIDVSDPDAADPDDGVFRVMAAVVDAQGAPAGRVSAAVTVKQDATTPDPGTAGDVVAAVNVGGSAFTAASGIVYTSDPGVSAGSVILRDRAGTPVAGTQDDRLFQTYAFGQSFSYDIALPAAGEYLVRLELIEPFWTAAGQRSFDVALEGVVQGSFASIDPFAIAGGQFTAVTLEQAVTVTDGTLDIDFSSIIDNALVSAIAVIALDPPAPGENAAPMAADDAGSVTAGAILGGNVLANDRDPDGDPLTVVQVNGSGGAVGQAIVLPSGARLTLSADGSYSYDPNGAFDALLAGQTAHDSFIYQVSDGRGGSATGNVTVVVHGHAEPGDLIAAVNVGGGAYAAVDTNIHYEADPGATGTITLRNLDGTAIEGTQDDPLYQTYGFGTFSYDVLVPVAGTYSVRLELVEPFWTAAGQRSFDVSMEGAVPAAFDDIDVVRLAGGPNRALSLTATVEVTDGVLDLDFLAGVDNAVVSGFSVYLAQTAAAPIADDAVSTDEDVPVIIDVLANDGAGAALHSVGAASNGTVAVIDGKVEYIPDADFFGQDSFIYVATNAAGETQQAQVTVDVAPVNDAPRGLAYQGAAELSEKAAPGTVLGLVSGFDVDGDTLVFTVDDPRFEIDPSGQLRVAPGADLSVASDTALQLAITADDGHGGSTTLQQDFMIRDEAPPFVAAFNVGGDAYTSRSGIVFAADPGVTAGSMLYYSRSQDIKGTEDDPIYQNFGMHRSFGYDIAVPEAGTYLVRLHMMEAWMSSPGMRVFDVRAEGVVPDAFDDIDLFVLGGGKRFQAVVLEATVEVTDGVLDLDFVRSVNNPLVGAIEIHQLTDLA